MTDLTAPNARAERDSLATRTEVLDKVKVLSLLPDDMHATTEQVATYFEVDRETILTIVKRNRAEIDEDGYRIVTRSAFEETFKMNVSSKQAARVALFPRRAILRIAMLLRDSEVARQVRSHLLDVEQDARSAAAPDPSTPLGVLAMAEQFAATARQLVIESEARQQLAAKVEHDAPLVAKAEAHSASKTTVSRQDFAREVQTWGKKTHGIWILQKHIMGFLAHKGVTVRGDRSDAGQATATAIKNGWAENSKYTDDNTGRTYFTTRLLPKGQDMAWKWINRYVAEHGTLELPRQIGPAA